MLSSNHCNDVRVASQYIPAARINPPRPHVKIVIGSGTAVVDAGRG